MQASEPFVSSDPFSSGADSHNAPPPPYESVVMNDGVSKASFWQSVAVLGF